ncbi:uncharacterized protein [Penaeus vannamei]|uniref:uncharacterized protein n=1 Tax=Penaeus vannamei TaxID=6689 RepID=UPI00387F623B
MVTHKQPHIPNGKVHTHARPRSAHSPNASPSRELHVRGADPGAPWDSFKRETLDAAQESIGERLRTRQNFISLETLEAADTCHMACLNGNRGLRRSLVCKARTLLRRDKEQFIRNLAEEVGHFLVNDLHPAYQALRKLNSNHSSQTSAVHSMDGRIISNHVRIRERWAEYFEQLYQVSLDARDVAIPVPDPLISEDPPTLTESSSIPPDLLRRVVIPLWKGKGDRWDCSNYRGITLLNILDKVFTHIHLKRNCNHLLRHQRPEQSGFTLGMSTIDHILSLRVIVEHRCEFGRGLLAAYIDLKKAFDSVHRESLWEILGLIGIPSRIIGLIASLYTGTISAVKCGGGLSSFFPVNLEVRQGCELATTLFNTCMDWIMGRANPLTALDAFSNEEKPLGLQVSWTKTKIQDFGGLLGELVQSICACGEDVEFTENFTYLGSAVHRNLDAIQCLESRLNAFCKRSLCRIMGYSWQDHVSNRRLHRETGMGSVICIVRDRQLRLYGHLARFLVDDPAHQVVRDNPAWRRLMGRPRKP